MSRVVSNTSPLIVLAKAGLLKILPKLFSEVVVPEAVRDEIMAGRDGDAMKQAWPTCDWLRVVVLTPPLSPLAAMQLGRGEAEAIEYARRQPDRAILLDDRAGRRAAQALGLRVFGTLSVAAIASRQGHVNSFDEALEQIRGAGLYVSDSVVETVRRGLQGNA
jgi:predicted nucleic acid-binding protein